MSGSAVKGDAPWEGLHATGSSATAPADLQRIGTSGRLRHPGRCGFGLDRARGTEVGATRRVGCPRRCVTFTRGAPPRENVTNSRMVPRRGTRDGFDSLATDAHNARAASVVGSRSGVVLTRCRDRFGLWIASGGSTIARVFRMEARQIAADRLPTTARGD